MHPRIEELLRHLDAHRAALRATVDRVPPERRERRPAPDRWSVANVLEHLAIVETSITRLLTGRVTAARDAGLGPERETSPVIDASLVERLLDRTTRFQARETGQPRGELDATAALHALDGTRAALREALLAADGLALGELTHPHPLFGPLDLYTWIAFVGGHESRHAAQIAEIDAELAGATSGATAKVATEAG